MRLNCGRLVATLSCVGLMSISIAMAQPPNATGLADGCTSCHGIEGHSTGRIPSLGGSNRARIINQLKRYRDQAVDATIMNRIARGYTDAEIEALADYFSSVGKP